MPIWLRRYTFNTMKEYFEASSRKPEKADNQDLTKGPDIKPSYTTKASK